MRLTFAQKAMKLAATSKKCGACKIEKSFDEFVKDNRSIYGRHVYCKPCQRNKLSLWRGLNREAIKMRERVRRDADPEKFRQKKSKWEKENPEKARNSDLKSKYGISLTDYRNLFEKQNGSCAICNIHQSHLKKSLHVDHCHESKIVRGLLCSKCNQALGLFQDSSQILLKASSYLGHQS